MSLLFGSTALAHAAESDLAQSPSATGQLGTAQAITVQPVAAPDAADPAATASGVPGAVPQPVDAVAASDRVPDRSSRHPSAVVDELGEQLADPILMSVGPSSSRGFGMQEGTSKFPLPSDGLLDDQAKAILNGGSPRSKGATLATGGPDAHGFGSEFANRAHLFRVHPAHGSSATARLDKRSAVRPRCARSSGLPQSSASTTGHAEAGDATSSADAGEDDPASSAERPVSAGVGQLTPWYVPVPGTVSTLGRIAPVELSTLMKPVHRPGPGRSRGAPPVGGASVISHPLCPNVGSTIDAKVGEGLR